MDINRNYRTVPEPEDDWVAKYRHSSYRRQLIALRRKLALSRAEATEDAAEKRSWQDVAARLGLRLKTAQ
jgi:hypothetical protein